MLSNREKMIAQLRTVLPYAESWYQGLADKQIVAIHRKELSNIIQEAKRQDENHIRLRCGLPLLEPRYEQQTLF